MNTFKWVMCNYDKWFFIEYENEKSFVGWFSDFGSLTFYSTSNFSSLYPNSIKYFGGRYTKITHMSDLKKDQWKIFIAKDRRELPRKMLMDVLK